MLVVVDYCMGTITSFPVEEPVLSSSTTAEIAANRSPPDTTAEDFYSPARDAHPQVGREEDTKPAGK
jgi:hypothetical protein